MSFGHNNPASQPPSAPYYPLYQQQPLQQHQPDQPAQTAYNYGYPPDPSGTSVDNFAGLDPSPIGGGVPPVPNQNQNHSQHYFHQDQPQPRVNSPYPPANFTLSQSPQPPVYPQAPQQPYPYQPQSTQGLPYLINSHLPYPQPDHLSTYQHYQPPLSHSPSASHSPAPYHSTPQRQPSRPALGGVDPSVVWTAPVQPSPQPIPPPAQTLPAILPSSSTQPPVGPSTRIKLRVPVASSQPHSMVSGRGSRSVAVVEQVTTSGRPQRGASQRAQMQMSHYVEQDEDEDEFLAEDGEDDEDAEGEVENGDVNDVEPEPVAAEPLRATRSGRTPKQPDRYGEDDFEDKLMPTSPPSPGLESRRKSGRGRSNKVIVDPDESEEEAYRPPARNAFPPRTRASIGSAAGNVSAGPSYTNGNSRPTRQSAQSQPKRARHSSADAEDFEPEDESQTEEDQVSDDALEGNWGVDDEEDDDFVSVSDRRSPRKKKSRIPVRSKAIPARTSRRNTRQSTKRHDDSDDEYGGGGRRNLRERTSRPNYVLPTMEDMSKEITMEEAMASATRPNGRPSGVGGLAGGMRFGASATSKGMPWSIKGKDLAQAMGDPDTSDSDDFAAPLKSGGAGATMANNNTVSRTNAVGPSDVPNYGRINPKSNTADADPLGVDMNVTFDHVGGLDDHINQLKEMVALPLLYPELFQQFGITPPRGVLFHGPPGTGKTLLARALAASCSSGNTKIAFFMRKGADVLSKWVGEAERQLRMLFEEARACQPSIIFFDEIDGIAPVRSSKQDQIHASLVSTLLALMDGMDGRGQVIVIGATNRPDAVDPALRRPGRFDREFYFPLPNRTARKKIIQINTRKWEPQLSDDFLERLAMLTKGYGGADLRALCTESALNAIQRRYPQIYKTTDRLLLDPASIHASAKDFMMSIKKIVPSSARSTSSAAVQLPSHLVPLLSAPLDKMRTAIDHVLPPRKHATALEEAEFEEEEGDSFEKHMMLQSLDKLRTFRPRILVHGEAGMGQSYLGPAILHHLEGFHVQSCDLGTLMGDSTRSVEAAVIQLIVEAKRHQPSIIFVPALSAWASTVSDAARSTIRALLDGIPPSDPILVLGVSDAPVDELPGDVRALFGFAPENKIELTLPTTTERKAYFADLITALQRPPTEFPDVLPRRKRVFETLPLAPPLPPRQPTQAEILREDEKDQAARDMIFQSFVHLVRDFFKRYRKVVSTVKLQAMQLAATEAPAVPAVEGTVNAGDVVDITALEPLTNGDIPMAAELAVPAVAVAGAVTEASPSAPPETTDEVVVSSAEGTAPPPAAATWQAHNVDIETLQYKLLKHKYYTPSDFLADITKIEENAAHAADADQLARVTEMASSARYHVQGFDQKWIPEFERYKERVRAKKVERQRKKEEAEKEKENTGEAQGDGPVADEDNLALGESSLKRAREDGEGAEGVDSQGREKRSRDEEMDLDPVPSQSQPRPNVAPATNGGSEHSLPLLSASTSAPADDSASLEQTASAAEPETTVILSVPPPAPAPAPVYPPFLIPEDDLAVLRSELSTLTSNLTIDQLEQLRASLFDVIWRGRGEWDRSGVIRSMRERLVRWSQEVEKWREAGRW